MASSSSTANTVDEHYFRALFNQNLFQEIVCKKKLTPEVNFDLEDEGYPAIREQIALRGWRRLASPRTKMSRLLIQEFYANIFQTNEEMEQAGQHPYKSYLGSGQPAQPMQLRRAELTPLARGWHEFIIHSIIPTGNRSEITIARAILIHSIIKGEDVRAE
ncbi:hypothetical protein PIB30_046191 [Stylosanthes scabra]|uniref:Uncharacterized protein n=1 Tax=Stylosanthes scabra TaxID=79078 RepID=A0ABU6YF64_9FABA|nr:hypothetical protein [Stylosanthes scabra]